MFSRKLWSNWNHKDPDQNRLVGIRIDWSDPTEPQYPAHLLSIVWYFSALFVFGFWILCRNSSVLLSPALCDVIITRILVRAIK